MYSRHTSPAPGGWLDGFEALRKSVERGPILPTGDDVEAIVARIGGNIPAQIQVTHEEVDLAIGMGGTSTGPFDIDAGPGREDQSVFPVFGDLAREPGVHGCRPMGTDAPARVIVPPESV